MDNNSLTELKQDNNSIMARVKYSICLLICCRDKLGRINHRKKVFCLHNVNKIGMLQS